jgi:hypothetical protein
MIKNLLLTAGLLLSVNYFAQTFSGVYSFSAVVGGTAAPTGTTDPTPPPTAANINFGVFTAVGTSSNSTANGVFSFTGWGTGATNGNDVNFTGAIDLAKYYNVTLTPANGYGFNITNMAFQATRSGTGVRNWSVRSSANGYASNIGTAACNNTNIAIQGGNTYFWSADTYTAFASQNICTIAAGIPAQPIIQSTGLPVSVRFYGWNAEGTGGTFRIDSVVFNGTAIFGAGLREYKHHLNAPFKLMPNPSSNGVLFIEPLTNDYANFQIMDILGNVVLVENNDKSGNKIKVDVSGLAEGTYFVRFNTPQKTVSEKLIITK